MSSFAIILKVQTHLFHFTYNTSLVITTVLSLCHFERGIQESSSFVIVSCHLF